MGKKNCSGFQLDFLLLAGCCGDCLTWCRDETTAHPWDPRTLLSKSSVGGNLNNDADSSVYILETVLMIAGSAYIIVDMMVSLLVTGFSNNE